MKHPSTCPTCPLCGGRIELTIPVYASLDDRGFQLNGIETESIHWYCEQDHPITDVPLLEELRTRLAALGLDAFQRPPGSGEIAIPLADLAAHTAK